MTREKALEKIEIMYITKNGDYDGALIENLCEVFDNGRTVEIDRPTSHRRRSELSVLDEDVAGIEQPTVEELEAEIPQYQRQFDVETFKSSVSSKVGALMNYTAKSKGYDNSYSLVGYVNSSNATWKAEADVFVNWRDSVWEAVFIEYSAIDSLFILLLNYLDTMLRSIS